MPIFGGVGGSQTFSLANGGKVYAYNTIDEATPQIVALANPARQSITFHNPGTTDIFIAPQFVQNIPSSTPTTGTNVAFTPFNASLGGCWRIYGNGGTLVITGECQGAWQALAFTGTGHSSPLTVMESNIS